MQKVRAPDIAESRLARRACAAAPARNNGEVLSQLAPVGLFYGLLKLNWVTGAIGEGCLVRASSRRAAVKIALSRELADGWRPMSSSLRRRPRDKARI